MKAFSPFPRKPMQIVISILFVFFIQWLTIPVYAQLGTDVVPNMPEADSAEETPEANAEQPLPVDEQKKEFIDNLRNDLNIMLQDEEDIEQALDEAYSYYKQYESIKEKNERKIAELQKELDKAEAETRSRSAQLETCKVDNETAQSAEDEVQETPQEATPQSSETANAEPSDNADDGNDLEGETNSSDNNNDDTNGESTAEDASSEDGEAQIPIEQLKEQVFQMLYDAALERESLLREHIAALSQQIAEAEKLFTLSKEKVTLHANSKSPQWQASQIGQTYSLETEERFTSQLQTAQDELKASEINLETTENQLAEISKDVDEQANALAQSQQQYQDNIADLEKRISAAEDAERVDLLQQMKTAYKEKFENEKYAVEVNRAKVELDQLQKENASLRLEIAQINLALQEKLVASYHEKFGKSVEAVEAKKEKVEQIKESVAEKEQQVNEAIAKLRRENEQLRKEQETRKAKEQEVAGTGKLQELAAKAEVSIIDYKIKANELKQEQFQYELAKARVEQLVAELEARLAEDRRKGSRAGKSREESYIDLVKETEDIQQRLQLRTRELENLQAQIEQMQSEEEQAKKLRDEILNEIDFIQQKKNLTDEEYQIRRQAYVLAQQADAVQDVAQTNRKILAQIVKLHDRRLSVLNTRIGEIDKGLFQREPIGITLEELQQSVKDIAWLGKWIWGKIIHPGKTFEEIGTYFKQPDNQRKIIWSFVVLVISVGISILLIIIIKKGVEKWLEHYKPKLLKVETNDLKAAGLRILRDSLPRVLISAALFLTVATYGLSRRGLITAAIIFGALAAHRFLRVAIANVFSADRPLERIIPMDNRRAVRLVLGLKAILDASLVFLPACLLMQLYGYNESLRRILLIVYQVFVVFIFVGLSWDKKIFLSIIPQAKHGLGKALRKLIVVLYPLMVLFLVVVFVLYNVGYYRLSGYLFKAFILSLVSAVVGFIVYKTSNWYWKRYFGTRSRYRRHSTLSDSVAQKFLKVINNVTRYGILLIVVGAIAYIWGLPQFLAKVIPMDAVLGWVGTTGLLILVILVISVVAVKITRLIPVYMEKMVRHKEGIRRSEAIKRAQTLGKTLRSAVIILIWSFALITILTKLGVPAASILATAGVGALAIGFGAQSLVKDVISGFFILLENQYRVGDVIQAGGVAGLVENITLRTTILRDLEGKVHTIPNGSITLVSNLTKEFSNAVLDIGVAYKEDVDRVREVLAQICKDLYDDPAFKGVILAPPTLFPGVDSLGDSAVTFKVQIRTAPLKQWDVAREFRIRVKRVFDEEGIEIPFPHRTVYLIQENNDSKKTPDVELPPIDKDAEKQENKENENP